MSISLNGALSNANRYRPGLEPAAIFRPSEVVPTAICRHIQLAATHFWALAIWVFSKGPKTSPKKPWLYANDLGCPRTKKRRFCISFPGVTCVFSGIPDISGRPGKSVELGRLAAEFPI